jgi:hypothetical protein
MRRTAFLALLLVQLGFNLIRAADAQPAVLDSAAVPYLKPAGRASYAEFLLVNPPRAIAIASSGAFGWQGGGTIDEARAKALSSCAAKGGTDCAIYAEDMQVTWRGRPPQSLPVAPGPLIATRDYAFTPDQHFFWWGPEMARGVVVWSHGKGNNYDGRGQSAPASMRAFNNARFDIVRFERAPSADYVDDASDWLHRGLATLRARGWRMIVAAGQSRGAWNSLQVLDTPGLADAVIAVSPASFSSLATQEAGLQRILHGIRATAARVAVVQFKGDIYVRDMPARIDLLRSMVPQRVAAALLIDEPEGIIGHGGGGSDEFSRRFGPCLLRFVTDPMPQRECMASDADVAREGWNLLNSI